MKQMIRACQNKIRLYFQKKLIRKLVLCCIPIIAVPVVAYGVIVAAKTEQYMINESKQLVRQQLDANFSLINKNYQTLLLATQTLATNSRLLKSAYRFDSLSTEELLDFKYGTLSDFTRFSMLNVDLEILRVYSTGSNTTESWPLIYSVNRLGEEETVFSEFSEKCVIGHLDNVQLPGFFMPTQYVSLFRKVLQGDGDGYGVVEAGMRLETFLGEMFSSKSETQTGFLLTGNGTLFTNEKNPLYQRLKEAEPGLHRFILEHTQGNEGFFETPNREAVIGYRYSTLLDSTLYTVLCNENTRNMIADNRGGMVCITLLLSIGLSALMYLISALFLKRVSVLKEYMYRVQDENLNIQPIDLGVDEVGDLARVFNNTVHAVNDLFHIVIEDEENLRKSELQNLHAQINWHFTFNTLETLEMSAVVKGDDEMADNISALGKLIRYSARIGIALVPLSEEIQYVENYLLLLNHKYDNKIEFQVEVSSAAAQVLVPRMVLQPIVENSFQHGLQPKKCDGLIRLHAELSDQKLTVSIYDNGIGVEESKLQAINRSFHEMQKSEFSGEHIALINVDQRLKAYFGREYGLRLDSDGMTFTLLTFCVPETTETEEENNDGTSDCR